MSFFEHQPLVLTGDGTDGFPVEMEFEVQVEDYLQGLNPKKRAKALILPRTPLPSFPLLYFLRSSSTVTQDMYSTILSVLLEPHSTAFSTAQFRFWAKRMFRLVSTQHANIVTHENRPVAVKDQIYNILVGCHGDAAHGGRDKTSAQVRRYYSWIPKELVSRFVKMCPLCIAKRKSQKPYFGDTLLAPAPISAGSNTFSSDHQHEQLHEHHHDHPAASFSMADYTQLTQNQNQAVYPIVPQSQWGDSFSSVEGDVGSRVDYNVYDQPFTQEPYEYPVYESYEEASPTEEEEERPYTGYSDSSNLYVDEPQSPLQPTLGHLPPLPYYAHSVDEQDYQNEYQPEEHQPQIYTLPDVEPSRDYSHDLAVWEATEQATGGGGSFALDPPMSYGVPTPMLEVDHATYDEDWEENSDEKFDPMLQHLDHDSLSFAPMPTSQDQHLPIQNRRATKPPPLDLSKTFHLFASAGAGSSLFGDHAQLRQCATGVPDYLSEPRDNSGPYSAPLGGGNHHFTALNSPEPSSACSSYSLASGASSSSNGFSLPLTPGSSYSGGIEHLALGNGHGNGADDDEWQQSSKDLAFAIQNLIDASNSNQQRGFDPSSDDDGIKVEERSERVRTRTRTVSAGGYLKPIPAPPSMERRGSATYGDYENDVLLVSRSPRKDERFSPYHRL
ncbi:hypothetical protein P7C70_g942, partial [Phenoliferia sp. Uapishka_3]